MLNSRSVWETRGGTSVLGLVIMASSNIGRSGEYLLRGQPVFQSVKGCSSRFDLPKEHELSSATSFLNHKEEDVALLADGLFEITPRAHCILWSHAIFAETVSNMGCGKILFRLLQK